MVFSSIEFLVFFLTLLLCLTALAQLVPHWKKVPKWLLLVASYVFYAFYLPGDLRILALLAAYTLVAFFTGRALHQAPSRQGQESPRRKLLLAGSIVFSLGMLGVFKYYNFFVDSASMALTRWGIAASRSGSLSTLNIILPAGISFYAFQTISYTVDVYRGRQEPVSAFVDLALLIAFFPKLVAGPLVRAAEFLPQLQNPVRIKSANVWAGSQIFIVGLFKKLMIADAVAPFVNGVFDYPEYYSSSTVWLAVIAYALQIYCDFSGYSDMAIGCARILGFDLGRNFYLPYLSANVQEFWRRWHISLSSWLRDYLYIPLGGNRKGRLRTYLNSIITMTLGGLWHGASWSFVIWGTAHGLALVVHRWWNSVQPGGARTGEGQPDRGPAAAGGRIVTQALSTTATLLFITLTWVLFRAPDIKTASTVYSKLLLVDAGGAVWHYQAAFTALFWAVVGHIVGSVRNHALSRPEPQAAGRGLRSPDSTLQDYVLFETPYSFRAAFFVMLVLLIIFVFAPNTVSPFVYFQF